ncbi:Ig-like domain-containing protein [Vibrio parahaemolyticus]|uniref:Ig-like domain-containing protein n=5 Tax=Vibrio parahaemolyticus TaxID=670 RepID=UPI00041941AE|nr:Ig-like domain-containing protein [Vibrio parahaemolyticus]MBE4069625.1 phage tail protein [Vibrio parahaemolyticus]MCZ6313178.1 Ig-like domain-containing protein [Vibrio parahaemolyticus]MCZ6416093.1 Ig-like domain-containing protein [Vibrio parahaemolyticus]MCZ6421290.1 Ig-like domain-containing protein [Vibrio parahaemolyticus]MDF4857798.1 Ig-like domain-containing protein [Vibrio parahaemolyticus]
MSDEFLHGIYTVESTTGSLAVTDVASSVIGIFGTSEKAEPMQLNHTTNYDDAYALFGEGSISKALKRIHTYVESNSVIAIPLGKDSDFPDTPEEPATSGVKLSSASATAYIDDGAAVSPVVVTNPHAATIAYTSSNEAAATVDADGLVTLVAEGETTITLNIEFDDGTEAASESAPQQATRSRKKGARSAQSQTRAAATETLTYTLTVAQTNPDAGKEANGATLSASKGVVYTGSPATPVELSNPNDLAVNYSSSDETVAIVDNGTGEITPLAEGVATITLELIGNATYQSSTLTYEVTVTAVSDALLAAFIDALPLLRKAGNKYGFSSKIHLAPGILHKTGAASLAVAAVKPIRGVWVGDMPEDVSTKEEAFAFKQQFGSDRYMPCWPRPLVIQDDGSTQVDWFAPSLAGLMAQVDRNGTGDTIVSETGYWCSPSNYPLVDIVGPSIDIEYIPSDVACDVNYLNANGIYTMINRSGWKGFGNYSSAYPDSTDLTSFLCVRRTADIIEESIETTTLQFIDKPMFTGPHGLQAMVCGRVRDTVNDYLRSKEGSSLVYSNVYLEVNDNPLVNLQQGKIKYRYQFTPPIPMQTVEYAAEIYVEGLESAFSSLVGSN